MKSLIGLIAWYELIYLDQYTFLIMHVYVFWNFGIQLCMPLCLLQDHLYIAEMLIFEYGHHYIFCQSDAHLIIAIFCHILSI